LHANIKTSIPATLEFFSYPKQPVFPLASFNQKTSRRITTLRLSASRALDVLK
jgi:hypothetical protein